MRLRLLPAARVYAEFHCFLQHGVAGPQEGDEQGRKTLRCPVCGRLFWHEQPSRHAFHDGAEVLQHHIDGVAVKNRW